MAYILFVAYLSLQASQNEAVGIAPRLRDVQPRNCSSVPGRSKIFSQKLGSWTHPPLYSVVPVDDVPGEEAVET